MVDRMSKLVIEEGFDHELAAYAEEWRQRLGLGDAWDIWLNANDAPGGNANSAGHTNLDTRYLRATITIMRSLSPERSRSVIRHELLHVALAPIDQAARYIVARLPKKDRKQAREMYIDAEEQTIERIVRSIDRSVP